MLALIDLVKIWGNGTIFSEQVKMGKNAKLRISTFFLTTAYQKRLVQKFSNLYRKLILTWATFETDTKKSWFFFWVCLSDSNIWMSLKKILTNFRLGTFFFFKIQLLFYMKIYKTKNFGVRTEKINYFTFGPKNPLRGQTHFWSGSIEKMFFSNYIIWFV